MFVRATSQLHLLSRNKIKNEKLRQYGYPQLADKSANQRL